MTLLLLIKSAAKLISLISPLLTNGASLIKTWKVDGYKLPRAQCTNILLHTERHTHIILHTHACAHLILQMYNIHYRKMSQLYEQ